MLQKQWGCKKRKSREEREGEQNEGEGKKESNKLESFNPFPNGKAETSN